MSRLPAPTLAILGVLAALLVGVLAMREFLVRSQSDRRAQAILAGAAQSRDAAEHPGGDAALRDDQTEQGRIWARANRATDPKQCPHGSVAFRLGCAQAIRASAR